MLPLPGVCGHPLYHVEHRLAGQISTLFENQLLVTGHVPTAIDHRNLESLEPLDQQIAGSRSVSFTRERRVPPPVSSFLVWS